MDEVIAVRDGRVGRLRLNRPRAIHALTLAMCDAMIEALLAWRGDPAVEAVLIDHAAAPNGDPKLSRGFCAGGDVRAIWDSARIDGAEARAFFFSEYRLNHLLFTYPKPVVAFMDGITMGGGVGIAQPAAFRVATERTVYAMPETGIGLFPDVGGGWYLSRLPGRSGRWLAVTGARIDGADAMVLGLATHYAASGALDAVKAEIAADPSRIGPILAAHGAAPPPSQVAGLAPEIDRLFASDRLEEIVAALEADGSDWATTQLAAIRTKSPQTMKVALRQLAESEALPDFAANMGMEYALGARIIQRPDFIEGVRALLVDKTGDPHWDPATIAGVTPALLDALFEPLPADEAWTPLPQASPPHAGA